MKEEKLAAALDFFAVEEEGLTYGRPKKQLVPTQTLHPSDDLELQILETTLHLKP